jgi:hypothetical protein
MKCYCCDKILTSQEATRRFKESGEFVDMCNNCLGTIDDDVEVTDGYQEDDDGNDDDQ